MYQTQFTKWYEKRRILLPKFNKYISTMTFVIRITPKIQVNIDRYIRTYKVNL